jgi:hypothetical protein
MKHGQEAAIGRNSGFNKTTKADNFSGSMQWRLQEMARDVFLLEESLDEHACYKELPDLVDQRVGKLTISTLQYFAREQCLCITIVSCILVVIVQLRSSSSYVVFHGFVIEKWLEDCILHIEASSF